ncbi:MAG: metal ABC transporter ATP-binding protein [Zetaproteobacteria bacterium]|nr:MAG: metal ABC transporter ATP-binding protein [Zetaproteobacteria bacterium]
MAALAGGDSATPVLEVVDLGFGPAAAPVLEAISFALPAGHFMGIVGPNGAGKSTLMRLLIGALTPACGAIRFFGLPMDAAHRRRILRRVAFVHQLQEHRPTLPITVEEVVAMGHPDHSRPWWRRASAGGAIAAALARVGLEGFARRDYRFLSGGQRQRVRLARALLRDPRVLLLDEPSAALDTPAQEQLYRLLRSLCDEAGKTVVMVEHDIAAISSFVDSVACLNRRIHHHAMRGEQVPPTVWQEMYGEHMHVVAHDHRCIGCHEAGEGAAGVGG